jgi:hypothetical protein
VLAARVLIAVAVILLLLLHINTVYSHKLLQLQPDATISRKHAITVIHLSYMLNSDAYNAAGTVTLSIVTTQTVGARTVLERC